MVHGDIFVIAAPSGAGKSSLVKGACAKDSSLQLSISHTSRPIRPNEVDGVDYFFVSDSQFKEMLERHEFIEHANVYGNYYGTNLNTIQQFMAKNRKMWPKNTIFGLSLAETNLQIKSTIPNNFIENKKCI